MKKRWIILLPGLLLCSLFACVNINVTLPDRTAEQETRAEDVQSPGTIEPEAQAPVSDRTANDAGSGMSNADPDARRYVALDNLCWDSTDIDGSPDFSIIDRTHMTLSFPDKPHFSGSAISVRNESDDDPQDVSLDRQDDLTVTWNGDMAVISMTDRARSAHYSVTFGSEDSYDVIVDFVYGSEGDCIKAATPSWQDISLGLFNGTWDCEYFLAASEDAFFLSTDSNGPASDVSYVRGFLTVNEFYFDASDRTAPKPTRDPFKAEDLAVETENLLMDGGRFSVMSIRCGDLYAAVENGAIIFTTDWERRALWIFR